MAVNGNTIKLLVDPDGMCMYVPLLGLGVDVSDSGAAAAAEQACAQKSSVLPVVIAVT